MGMRSIVLAVVCLLAARAGAQDAEREPHALVAVGVGPGVGVRQVRVPSQVGERRLSTGAYPAVDLALQLGAAYGRWSLVASVEYRTSLGLRTDTSELADAPGRIGLRAHSLRAGITAGYRLGSGLRLALFSGWMVRALRSTAELNVPRYSLHGPLLRPELQLPIAQGVLELRAGPELGLIVYESRELRELASTRPIGLSLGAALAVDLRAHALVHVVLCYAFAHATQASAWSRALLDTEHVLSLRAELRY